MELEKEVTGTEHGKDAAALPTKAAELLGLGLWTDGGRRQSSWRRLGFQAAPERRC
jgi:hypothetical protein